MAVATMAKPSVDNLIKTNPKMNGYLNAIKIPGKRLFNLTLLSPGKHIEKARNLLHLYINPQENGHSKDYELKLHDAISHLKMARHQGDTSPDTLLLLGAAYVFAGKWNEATKVFKAFEGSGDNLRQFYLGALLMQGLGLAYRNSKSISSVPYFIEADACEAFAKSIMKDGEALPQVFIEMLEYKKKVL